MDKLWAQNHALHRVLKTIREKRRLSIAQRLGTGTIAAMTEWFFLKERRLER